MTKTISALLLSIVTLYGCTPQLSPELQSERQQVLLNALQEEIPFLVEQCVNVFINGQPVDEAELEKRKYTNFTLGYKWAKHFKKAYPGLSFQAQQLAFNGSESKCGFFIGGIAGLHAHAQLIDMKLVELGFERSTEKRVFKKGFIYNINGQQVVLLGKQVSGSGATTVQFKLRPRITSGNT